MKKIIEKYLYVLVIVTCIFILVGCASKPKPVQNIDPIAHAKQLGVTLGCVFAPETCPKSKEQIKKEQDEITRDFDKVDAQSKADQDQTQPASK